MRQYRVMEISEQATRRRELAVTEDPRAARTRDRIVDALDALLAVDANASVAAICARAGVGRSTFYTHFATVSDVVIFVVDAMFDDLGPRDVERRAAQRMTRSAITEIGMRELMAAMEARRGFFRYAESAPAAERVRERLTHEMAHSLRGTIMAERPDASGEFIETACEFIAGGVMATLFGWLTDDGDRDSDSVIAVVSDLLPGWLTGNQR